MNNNDGMLDEAKAQEAYEDALFKLAMIRLEEKRMEQLVDESEEGNDILNLQMMQSEYQSSLPMIRKRISSELKRRQRRRFIIGFGKVCRTAAVILLVLYMSATAALSTSAEAREYVGRLLINLYSDHTEVNMLSAESSRINVPSKWKGEYFMKYIPDGFYLMSVGYGHVNEVIYVNDDVDELCFWELTAPSKSNINTEYAITDYVYINEAQALRSQADGRVTLTWSMDGRYFTVGLDGSPEEAQRIAESVVKIR